MKKGDKPSPGLKVRDVRAGLKQMGLSPEELSRLVPVSNMTIRRLLRKEDKAPVPPKYAVHFEKAFAQPEGSFSFAAEAASARDMDSLAIHLAGLSAQSESPDQLKSDLEKKLKGDKFDSDFLGLVRELKKWAFQSQNRSVQLIAIGALIYFILPLDLVPDHLFPLGYVDDLGIMTLALMKIKTNLAED